MYIFNYIKVLDIFAVHDNFKVTFVVDCMKLMFVYKIRTYNIVWSLLPNITANIVLISTFILYLYLNYNAMSSSSEKKKEPKLLLAANSLSRFWYLTPLRNRTI